MVLSRLPERHLKMLKHWIDFTQDHREALLMGRQRDLELAGPGGDRPQDLAGTDPKNGPFFKGFAGSVPKVQGLRSLSEEQTEARSVTQNIA